jgi:hypothetical protein
MSSKKLNKEEILRYLDEENFKILDDIKNIDPQEYNIMIFDGSRKKNFNLKKNEKKTINLNNINQRIIKDKWFDEEVLNLLASYKKYYGKNNEIIFLLTPYHPEVWKLDKEPIVEAMIKVELKIHEFSNPTFNPKSNLSKSSSLRSSSYSCLIFFSSILTS